jgi:uncharacterized membrane protein YbjE (DUF340 family)
MVAGILLGFLLRNKSAYIKIADKATMWAIFLLLFMLGVAIGANQVIIKNLHLLGFKALAIALGGVTGSVVVAWIGYKIWFNKVEEDEN